MTHTPGLVCTCGDNSTTEVYHEPYCPLYRVQRAGSKLLVALMACVASGALSRAGADANAANALSLALAAIRKATGQS